MKIPEEIDRLELLAASYACDYRDSPNKTNGIPDSYLVYSIAYDAFLDGYKAAKDQVADADKVMPQWISVKDRLPEIPDNNYSNRVLLFRADGFIVIARIEKCVRFVRPLEQALIVETDNGDPIEEFTYWQPLPKPPEDK